MGEIPRRLPLVECGYCFCIIGLACRWCETNGIEYFDAYNAVILDEIGSVEINFDYRFLFEVMLAVQKNMRSGWSPF